MTRLLGIDTGGTYTDAVLMDEKTETVLVKAKALTSRPDLALGIGAAIDAVLSDVDPADIGLVSLSTTLATNALVEGQGGRVALVFIGFGAEELDRAGLRDALAGDPAIVLPGGHDHTGQEIAAFDGAALATALADLSGVTGFAVAAQFATRNPAHECAARDLIRAQTGLPVTCSHELSQGLGGPKRALTAVLNARLIGMIDGLITACEGHLAKRGIDARLMVVRGDGALVPADLAREKPIETILSGPAASLAGAAWLSGESDALVSDIGGTTTDICLLVDGQPAIDPAGAQVGQHRTMVEAVAMRTSGLGGDSAVTLASGLTAGLRLGPRRLMPIALLAQDHSAFVHDALDHALSQGSKSPESVQFALPLWHGEPPAGLDKREAQVAARLQAGPQRMTRAVTARIEAPALMRLVARGLVLIAGVTPSDAAHVLGLSTAWDSNAAQKALTVFAAQRDGAGNRIAADAPALAQAIIDQMTAQSVDCLLQAAFAEDPRDWDRGADVLAAHPLTRAGLDQHQGIIATSLRLGVPVVGLGASAKSYYPPVGARLRTRMIVPDHADVANAIGAIVGQVRMQQSGTVTSDGPGRFVAHLPDGPARFGDHDVALAALESALCAAARTAASAAGVAAPRLTVHRDIQQADVEGTAMFVSATLRVIAAGRPRIARG